MSSKFCGGQWNLTIRRNECVRAKSWMKVSFFLTEKGNNMGMLEQKIKDFVRGQGVDVGGLAGPERLDGPPSTDVTGPVGSLVGLTE